MTSKSISHDPNDNVNGSGKIKATLAQLGAYAVRGTEALRSAFLGPALAQNPTVGDAAYRRPPPLSVFLMALNVPSMSQGALADTSVPEEEQRSEYLHHEWREQHGWFARASKKLDAAWLNTTKLPWTEEQLRSPAMRDTETSRSEFDRYEVEFQVQSDDEILIDANGIPLLVFLPDAQSWFWEQDSKKVSKLLKISLKAILSLAAEYEPNLPETTDPRHADYTQEREKAWAEGHVHGVLHFGLRRQKEDPTLAPLLTEETTPGPMELAAACRWYREMAPVHQTMGMLVRLFSKPMYDYHRTVYDYWAGKSSLNALERTKRAVYVYNEVHFNSRVRPHRDDLDLSGILTLMSCAGDFKDGGNVIVPLAKKQYKLRSGGILLLNDTLLEHGVGSYNGTRISFFNTIHEKMCILKGEIPRHIR